MNARLALRLAFLHRRLPAAIPMNPVSLRAAQLMRRNVCVTDSNGVERIVPRAPRVLCDRDLPNHRPVEGTQYDAVIR